MSGTGSGKGTGEALDATVVAEDNVPPVDGAEEAAKARAIIEAKAHLAAAYRARDKAQEQLEAAELSLARAQAETEDILS